MANPINLTISLDAPGVTRAGFGTAMMALANGTVPAVLTEMAPIRTYESMADMTTDGWSAANPGFVASTAFAAQNPRPQAWKVGRLLDRSAQVVLLTVNTAFTGDWDITINGQLATYAATVGPDTPTVIAGALRTAINALGEPVTCSGAGASLIITADAAGQPFTFAEDIPAGGVWDGPFLANSILITGAGVGTYILTVNGQAFTFTAGAGDTVTTIRDGLNALLVTTYDPTANVPITVTTSGVDALAISSAYQAPTVVPSGTRVGDMAQAAAVANYGQAEGLAWLLAVDPDWYGLICEDRTPIHIEQAATWTEANRRFYLAQSSDPDTAAGLAAPTNLGLALASASLFRTALLWYSDNTVFGDAAWMAKKIATDLDNPPITYWAHAILATIPTDQAAVSATVEGNLEANDVNFYSLLGSNGATYHGTVADGRRIDELTTVDWIFARMTEDLQDLFSRTSNRNEKIPFTDQGIRQVGNTAQARLDRGVVIGHFAADPAPFVTMPLAREVDPADKAARRLAFSFAAQFSGAVESLDPITGIVTTTLPG